MLEMQAAWLGVPTPEKVALDQSAENGLSAGIAGLEAEVIHTPGHTPGSICLLFPKQELLLAGDTLFAGSVGRTDLPGGDSRRLLRSIHTRLLPCRRTHWSSPATAKKPPSDRSARPTHSCSPTHGSEFRHPHRGSWCPTCP